MTEVIDRRIEVIQKHLDMTLASKAGTPTLRRAQHKSAKTLLRQLHKQVGNRCLAIAQEARDGIGQAA